MGNYIAEVLGFAIGTYEDFEPLSGSSVLWIGFVPSEGVDLPACDLGVRWEDGDFLIDCDEDEVCKSVVDIYETLLAYIDRSGGIEQ